MQCSARTYSYVRPCAHLHPYPHVHICVYINESPMCGAVDYFENFSWYVKSQFPSVLKNVIEISVDSFDCKFNECSLWLSHSAQESLKNRTLMHLKFKLNLICIFQTTKMEWTMDLWSLKQCFYYSSVCLRTPCPCVGSTFLNSHSACAALGEQVMFKGHFTFICHNQRNVTIKIS